ncbi:hypothetical protein BsWGS_14782 [Bradybaena similaris]
MSGSLYRERQDEELQVLESIFGRDVIDLRRKAAWNVFQPLELKLTLKPQQSMGDEGNVYVQLDMVIKCPPKYPDVVPEISLTNPKGLSNQLVAELKAELEKQAAEAVGEVMIWQLANSVQAFLHTHNKPPAQSFYEQMINNKKQQQERTKELERQKEEQKRQQIEQDLLKQQEALRNEKRRRNEDLKTIEASTPLPPVGTGGKMVQLHSTLSPINPAKTQRGARSVSPATPFVSGSTSQSRPHRQRTTSTPMRTEDDDSGTSFFRDQAVEVTTLTFSTSKVERIIQRGKCLGHSSSGSTIYAGMDKGSGDLVAVAEWVMQWRNVGKRQNSLDREDDKEGESHMKQILSIEQELTALLRLNHPNLIRYLAWRHQYQPGRISVNVLMEYSGGTNLSVYTQHKDPLPLEMLRIYTGEVLQALCYLHRNSIVHKNLRASSVFIDSIGKVRLGDYSIDKRLGDLYLTLDKDRPRVHFSEPGPMVLGRGGQRGDIYQLGLMLLTLIQGHPLKESMPYIPPHLPTVLQDFLHKTLLKDERLRWTASQLLEHSFIKSPLLLTPAPAECNPEKVQAEVKGKEVNNDENSDNKEEEEFEYLSSLVASGQSRLASEFELLKVLGKGGFGDVLKVKNKLDGRFYAIKRIPLNPKSKMFNKKMKREVKLLSRLNHENVVRYYCSWIEISEDPAQSETSSSFTSSSQAQETAAVNKRAPHIVRSIPLTKTPVIPAAVKSANSSFDPIGDIENLVPRATDESVEWATSFDKGAEKFQDSSSSEEEDEADVFGSSFMPKMDRSDDSIVFDTDGDNGKDTISASSEVAAVLANTQSQEAESEPEDRMVKILYIQMEYCEKSTLRNCIDAGLWCDMDRVWRLFREIVEGLVHIHGQGMIHRDLKPVNIFLDSHDNVKIGDFGLATTDILAKKGAFLDVTLPSAQDIGLSMSRSGYSSGDGNLTGKVGTALYVSPEVMEGRGKVHYDQKVDIYSLGIIFFEMCYKALPTGMERVKILSNLRSPGIDFPEDFDCIELSNQSQIIRWLLNHDPARRPTSKELLGSDLLPPPIMQETELSEILRSTICNPQSTSYRYMLNAIFSQNVSSVQELTYDHDIYENMNPLKTALVYQHVKNTVSKIFTNHGAIQITLPLFMPKCGIYDNNEQLVRLMDQRGGIVSVPLDLRVPFARYVGRHNVQSMKRFAIEKVFRDKHYYNVLYNVHPKELTECAFDIITTSNSLIPDAEVLSIVQEIIDKSPALQARNYYVRINHMSVLRAVLLHCGIPEIFHVKALLLLSDNDMNKSKRAAMLEAELKLKMTEQMSSLLNFLLDTEGQLSKVTSILRSITKTMGLASSLAKSGLHDIENILSYATSLGLRLQVLVSVGLIYNPTQYSGVMFQIMCDVHKKKKVATEVIAAGGRYDKLIEKFSSPLPQYAMHNLPHGVGVSIAFERLAGVIAEDEQVQTLSPCDVMICTLGHQLLIKERLAIARDLWAAGFRADVLFDKTEDFDELQVNCRNKGISHIVILKDSETSAVKVRSLEKERMTEKSVYVHALVDYLQKKTTERVDLSEPSSTPSQRLLGKENQSHGDCVHTVTTSNINGSGGNGPTYNYSIMFVPQEGRKFPQVARRRHEALIAGKASAQFPWLLEKNLEVLALEIPTSVIKTLQAYLELSDPGAFESSIPGIMEKQAKSRKYLVAVLDVIHDLRFNKKCSFILLYSTKEESLRLLS